MKKSVIAAGVVVALGVCWAGSAWYTGKQVEPNVADFVSAFNKTNKEKSPHMGMTLSYKDFSRGVFSSHFQVVLTFDHGTEASGIKSGQNITFNVDVDHGPFPLSSLARGNLGPAMAAMNVSPVNGELTKPLFDAAKGHSPVDANIRVGYDKSASTQLVVAPATYANAKTTFSFKGGKFNVSGDHSFLLADAQINGQLDDILINQEDKNIKIYSDSMTFTSISHIADKKIPIGGGEFILKNIRINVSGKDTAHIGAFHSKTDLALSKDNNHLNFTQEYSIDDLMREKQNLGSGKIALLIENIDPVAFRQLITDYNLELSKALVAHPELANNEAALQELSGELILKYLVNLQKSEPVIKLPFIWKNEKGDITADLNIAIANPAKATVTPGSFTETFDHNVKSVSANVMLPLDVMTHINRQVKLANGDDESSAQKQAEKDVKNFTSLGKMMDVIAVDDKAAKFDLQYKLGHVIFNGKEMTAEEFMARRGGLLR